MFYRWKIWKVYSRIRICHLIVILELGIELNVLIEKIVMRYRILTFLIVLISPWMFSQELGTDWSDLVEYNEAPQWFRDAKFGIYFHWGPYSVPAFGNEHYPRTMYGHFSGKKPVQVDNGNKKQVAQNVGVGFQTFREHEYHSLEFGDPSEMEYHDMIPLFTARSFNAEEWADLFFLSGAKFAGPVAIHHDGFAMWDSELTPWNASDMGPERDITGELSSAIRKREMKLVCTFHHARVGQADKSDPEKARWYYYGRQEYLKRTAPEVLENQSEELDLLYGTMPWDSFCDFWEDLLKEVVDNYQPDLIWFDSWLDRIPQEYRKSFVSYYLNAAESWGREVVITYKQNDLPQNVGVLDLEKGRMDNLTEYSWLTDGTISDGSWATTGSWSYTEELDIKSSKTLLHILIDIVSKNGNFMLNISPTAEGIIPEEQRKSLLEMGTWLRANGEAIYGTRPFVCYGEGPKRIESGGGFVQMSAAYNEENFRYTTKGDTVYAFQMDWAGSYKEFTLSSFAKNNLNGTVVTNVSILDSPEKVSWRMSDEGLVIRTPFSAPNKKAICFRIETSGWKSMESEQTILLMEPIRVDG